jgi:phosphate transport system permease protein
MLLLSIVVIISTAWLAFVIGRRRGASFRNTDQSAHSLAQYHGFFLSLVTTLPLAAVLVLWSALAPSIIETSVFEKLGTSSGAQVNDPLVRATLWREIQNAASQTSFSESARPEIQAAVAQLKQMEGTSNVGFALVGLLAAVIGFIVGWRRLTPDFRARNATETALTATLFSCAAIAILATVGIVASVLFETLHFFTKYPVLDFLFGTQWSPQTALREDQVGQSGAFGFLPLLSGTVLIMLIAMTVAVPIGLLSAIYLSEYASPRMRSIGKPMLELLAGVPTVVFGFFAALTVAPFIRSAGQSVGLDVASESALAAGLVMGMMIIPFVSSLSDDVINAVPQTLRDGSYAIGATKSETIKKVVLPAALAGIVAAIMLAMSRAVGETMIVVMAAGLSGKLSFNPLDAVTTITVQIKTLLVGDQEFDSAKTLSAFALGFVLFFFTLILNVIALKIVGRYKEQYD